MTTVGDMRFQKRVGGLLLLVLIGLVLWHSVVVRPRTGFELAWRRPSSLPELFGGAPYRTAQTAFEFYAQAARFSGATLYLTEAQRRHEWFLRRVAGLEVVVIEPAEARAYVGPAPHQACQEKGVISSRLDDKTGVRICPGEAESDYVLLESSRTDELLFVPTSRRDDR